MGAKGKNFYHAPAVADASTAITARMIAEASKEPTVANTEENTHGASGIAQLNARVHPWRADANRCGPRAGVDTVTATRFTAMAMTTVATTTTAAAIPNDTQRPGSPAEAIAPERTGPTAKPAVKTAPATAAPTGPCRSEAYAVQALIARPTPSPTIKRPTSDTAESCESSIATVPTRAVAEPAQTTG